MSSYQPPFSLYQKWGTGVHKIFTVCAPPADFVFVRSFFFAVADIISSQNLAFKSMSRFNLICLKFARFSSDEKSSLSTYVPRRPILPLFDPFSLSECAVRHPISIQPPFSLYQQVVTWYNGGTFFCSSFFSPSFFFTSKLVEPHQTDSIAHLIAQCYKRQIFFSFFD